MIEKRLQERSEAVKRRLHVRCSYSETGIHVVPVLKSVTTSEECNRLRTLV
jgi:hypothetical protein